MKSFKIFFCWFKLIRTTVVSAYHYNEALKEFERVMQLDKKFVLKIILE